MNFEKLFDTLTGPVLGIAASLIPGGPAILGAINAFLPDDKKLPDTATGGQMMDAVNQLPAADRASLMEKRLDVEMAEINTWASIQESHAKADATGSSTRPAIAMMMAWVVIIEIVIIVSAWGYAVITKDFTMVKAVGDAWPMLLAIVATPSALLRAYFGMRTKEKTARYSAASGQPVGAIAGLIKAFK